MFLTAAAFAAAMALATTTPSAATTFAAVALVVVAAFGCIQYVLHCLLLFSRYYWHFVFGGYNNTLENNFI